MTRFGFNIRTRDGENVDNIVIVAQDGEQAERRLRQLYTRCEVVNRLETGTDARRVVRDPKHVLN